MNINTVTSYVSTLTSERPFQNREVGNISRDIVAMSIPPENLMRHSKLSATRMRSFTVTKKRLG